MCGRFNLTASGEEIAEAFGLEDTPELAPRYNIAPTQPVAVVRRDTASRRLTLGSLRWGLVPEGAPETDRGHINARSETAWQKPAFRDAFAHRRCLVPATGFYEWQTLSQRPRRRQPWAFALGSGRLFAFAGLWEPPAREGAPPSCTILTTDPNEVTRPVHDRMPVILAPADYAPWLDPQPNRNLQLRALLKPFPSEAMTAWPVSTAVNSPKCDEPSCLEPVEARAPPRLLF